MANNLTLSVTLNGDGRQLSGTLKDARNDVREFGTTTERESRKADTALTAPRRSAVTVSEHLRDASREARTFGTETVQGGREASQALSQTSGEAQTVTGHLDQLRTVAAGVGVALATIGARDFAMNAYAAVSSSQQLQGSLKTVTGSIENASAAWDTLLGFAAETPFTLDQSVQAFIRMQSLGLNPSLEALRSYGNTASAMGKDMMQMVEAVADATTGEFERLKEFGIRASKEGEQISFTFQGVTTTVANSAAAISQYLQQIGENQFAGAMGDQMDTLSGKASNLEDTIYQFYLAVGDAGAADIFESTLANASNTVQFLTDNIDTLATGAEVMAVLIGGRVVVALANVTASKVLATQQTIAYQLALARMAGVSGTAAAAQTALAGATRAASGAMMLLGGPAGAVALAGLAIYTFRDELGLTIPQIDANTTAVNQLTNGLDDMNQAAAQLTLTSLVGQLAEVRAQAEVTAEAFTKVGQIEGDGGGGFLGVDVTAQTNAVRELGETSNATQQEAANLEAAIALVESRIGQLGERNREVTPTVTEIGDASETAAAKAKEMAKAASEQADAIEALRNRMIPHRQETVQLAQDQNTLNLAFAMGRVSAADYVSLMGALQQSYMEVTDTSKKAADQISMDVSTWTTISENGIRRVDDAGVDLWLGLIDGSRNAMDTVKRGIQQSLAEIAHMLTTQKFTVQVAGMLGLDTTGMAGGGNGGFNLNSLGSLGRSASSLLGLGGSAAAPSLAMQGGLSSAALASAGQVAGGAAYGGWAGSAASGAALGNAASGGIMSAITSGVSAAMPWIAGGLAIDSLLGGGITKAIGSLFGGGKTNPHLNIDTRATDNYGHGSVRTGAFGAVGFAQGTRRSNDLFGGIPEEREFLAAVAASDDLLASLARSPEELDRMANAVQGVRLSASNVEGIMGQLSNRTVAAVKAIDGDFGAFVSSLGTDVDTIIARTQSAMAALNLLGSASENLNLQFDASATGALRAADNIAQFAGGVDQLNQLQNAYYQAFFTDAERAANLQRELTSALGQLGYALPSTRDGFRALVEQQDQMTESGQQTYVQLLQLAGGFDQLQTLLQQTSGAVDGVSQSFEQMLADASAVVSDAEAQVRRAYQVFDGQQFDMQLELLALMGDAEGALALERERELASIDESLRPMRERIWAMQDEAEAQQRATQAAQGYIRELTRVRDQLSQQLGSISGWLDQQMATSGAPQANLATAQEQFARQLVRAENGDRDALQSITQYAQQVLDANRDYNASSPAGQRIEQDVFSALKDLPKALSDAEFIVEGFRGIVTDEMAAEIERAIFASQYTIDALIEFAADASALPQDLRTILGEQAHQLDSTLNYLLGENQLDSELRQLALASSNNLVATVDYIARSQLSNSDKLLALSSSNTMTALIDYVVGTDIDRDSRVLALEESNRYSAIVNMLLGRDISADDRRLALESVNGFTAVVDYVIRSPLTGGDRRLALSAGQQYEALIGYYVNKDISKNDRTLALNSANRYLANVEFIVGRDISSSDRRLALNSNNRYVSTIDQLIGKQIGGGDRRLALNSTNAYLTTVDAVLKRGISADVRTFGLANSNAIMTTVDGILASGMSGDVRTLALKSSNRFVTTLEAALKDGRITGDERKLLDARSADVIKTLKTSGSLNLTTDEWAVINAASGTQRLQLLADVAFGRTDLDHLKDIDDNTRSLEERALEQLTSLNGLVSEMSRTTDQFVGLNSTMISLRESINALGVAQNEIARIEQERVAAQKAEQMRVDAGRVQSKIDEFYTLAESTGRNANDNVDRYRTYNWIDGDQGSFVDRIDGWTYQSQMAAWTARRLELAAGRESELERMRREYRSLTGELAPFANGGWTGPGGKWDPAGIVHAEEFVVRSEVVKQPGVRGMLEALNSGQAVGSTPTPRAAPLPNYPLLGNSDIVETLRDLKREVAELRRDNARLQGESNKHLAAANNQRGAAATQQIAATERGNKMLKKMEDDKRLEAAKR